MYEYIFEMTIQGKEKFEKDVINYIDVVYAILHFLIIIFPLIILRSKLILIIIGISFAGCLLILFIYTFSKNNPSYFNYGIALLLSNFFFLIPSIILFLPILIILIPEAIYVYIILGKNRAFSASNLYADARYKAVLGRVGFIQRYDPNTEVKKGLQREEIEQYYKTKKHLIQSLIFLISLLVVFFLWYDL